MNNFLDISASNFEYFKSHPVKVYEKLNMTRFSVDIIRAGIFVYSAKNRIITNVDTIINSVNDEIMEFVNRNIEPIRNEIIREFGEIKIWFYYLPNNKTKVITYDEMPPGTFIMSDIYTARKDAHDINAVYECFKNVSILYEPINQFDLLDDLIADELKAHIDSSDVMGIVNLLTAERTFSGNSLDSIEGLIIKCGKKTYKLIINDTTPSIDMPVKMIYRDSILCDFADVVLSDELKPTVENILDNIFDDKVTKICKLFLEYLNHTDIFSRLFIESDDFLPPVDGYIGDIKWSVLPSTVQLVCKNSLYKNILRILLASLCGTDDKFAQLSDDTSSKMCHIMSML